MHFKFSQSYCEVSAVWINQIKWVSSKVKVFQSRTLCLCCRFSSAAEWVNTVLGNPRRKFCNKMTVTLGDTQDLTHSDFRSQGRALWILFHITRVTQERNLLKTSRERKNYYSGQKHFQFIIYSMLINCEPTLQKRFTTSYSFTYVGVTRGLSDAWDLLDLT